MPSLALNIIRLPPDSAGFEARFHTLDSFRHANGHRTTSSFSNGDAVPTKAFAFVQLSHALGPSGAPP
jgi:hypothetical protein